MRMVMAVVEVINEFVAMLTFGAFQAWAWLVNTWKERLEL